MSKEQEIYDLERISKSLSSMIIEWVDTFPGGDWRSGLPLLIQGRLHRLLKQQTPRPDEEPQRSEGDTALQQAQQKFDTKNTVEDPESDSVEFRGLML